MTDKELIDGFLTCDLDEAGMAQLEAELRANPDLVRELSDQQQIEQALKVLLGDDTADQQVTEYDFEAGWGPEGAVCVRHVRVKDNVSLAELERLHPRLKGRTGAVCTEDFARAHGALLFNRSQP